MPKPVRPVYHLYRWLWGSLDLLYPPVCGGCERRGVHWCEDCQKKVIPLNPPFCEICGQSLTTPGLCNRCLSESPHFSALRSWAIFGGPVQKAIHRLKYGRDISLGIIMARPLCDLLDKLEWQLDAVIPVPLGVARLRERGYNQAILIARPLALRTGLSYEARGLLRVRETRSQVGLSYEQRQENVCGAFQAKPDVVANRRILLIDDVTTSSATINACGKALLSAGANEVYGLTLARA
jgi:competence protein ComFC